MSLELSILLVTFNHEQYIKKALNSIFEQEYKGEIELVVADDDSTDATLEIIKAYEGRDARFVFKYLKSDVNLGITKNYQRGFAACQGGYIAVLEGDDYWINSKKLLSQIVFLKVNSECSLCATNYMVKDEDNGTFYPRSTIEGGYKYIKPQELIFDNLIGNFSTCMYRKSALYRLPSRIYEEQSYDWIINICIGMNGLIVFFKEPMSVYRIHSSGAWSRHTHLEKIRLKRRLISTYNKLSDEKFDIEFQSLKYKLGKEIYLTKAFFLVKDFKRLALRTIQLFRCDMYKIISRWFKS